MKITIENETLSRALFEDVLDHLSLLKVNVSELHVKEIILTSLDREQYRDEADNERQLEEQELYKSIVIEEVLPDIFNNKTQTNTTIE